jgi:multiple sugar transport system substrate-binding protein
MKKVIRNGLSLMILLSLFLAACGGAAEGTPAGNATEVMPGGEVTEPVAGTTPTGADTGMDETATPAGGDMGTEAAGTPAATAAGTEAAATPASTEGAGVPGTGMELPADCSSVQLQYWNPFTGPDGPFMGQMVDEFNTANPNIQVTMTSQAEYYTQLTTAAAAGTLPDVAIVHADQVATQAFRNVLRPIDDVVSQMGIDGSDFPEAVWAAGDVAGKRYSIPLDIHPMTMFYNADLLSEAGVDNPPQTLEEFESAATAMTQGDNNGFMITTGFPVQQIFQMLLHQFGGTEFSEDGSEATWNSEAGVRALEWMQKAQSQWSQSNLEVDAELNAFKTGTVGMIWNGIWQTTNVTGEGVEFNGQATSVPQIGDQMAVWAGSHQFTLPAQQNPDPCKDAGAAIFINYILQNSVTWAKAGQIPASNTVRQSQDFMAVEPQASIATSVESAFFPPAVPGITDAFAPLGEAVAAIMSGTATDIQATLDDSVARANEILQQNKSTYGDAPQANP